MMTWVLFKYYLYTIIVFINILNELFVIFEISVFEYAFIFICFLMFLYSFISVLVLKLYLNVNVFMFFI